jgi:hypothetical protein
MFPSDPPTEEDTMMLRTSAALAVLLLAPVSALARNVHFVGTPTCTASGSQLCCSGKLAGLGTAPTSVQVLANFTCTNKGGNNPPGQASGQSAPIQPSGGQITFTNVCTSAANCPDDMTPSFGSGATINVLQGNNLVFSATVPVS